MCVFCMILVGAALYYLDAVIQAILRIGDHAIAHIEESISPFTESQNLRWFAIKIFERDEKAEKMLSLDAGLKAHLELHIRDCEKEMEDDSESIITNQRYAYITRMISAAVVRKPRINHMLRIKPTFKVPRSPLRNSFMFSSEICT